MVEMVVLAHLHTSRATVPMQTTMIEASIDQLRDYAEKEWYFGNQEKERHGPFSFPEVSDSRPVSTCARCDRTFSSKASTLLVKRKWSNYIGVI